MNKKLFFFIAAIAIIFMGTNAYALEIFFEHREVEEFSRGVVYEQNRMMTSRGMLDVHVLFVDLNQPYITLAPVASSRELGLRETTSRLLSDAGAVAGINADFFSMNRLHSTYFGPMVQDGQVISLNGDTNSQSNDLATFFLDMHDNPFFLYMRTSMKIFANGEFLTNIVSYNSIGATIQSPVIVSRAAMNDTSAIDIRISDITKFVVVNNYVTQITTATVETPENGFVILIDPESLVYYRNSLNIGTHVNFHTETDLNVDFSAIQTAIGGGSVILVNGQLVEGGVEPNRRHPRSAIGAMRSGRIVLLAVDGRTHSIGVTHEELGIILRRYGVVNAMHFDGGGSTTMVTRDAASGNYSVANTPSDGSQRRITNALGVFDNSPTGAMTGVILQPEETLAIAGVPLPVNFYGVDSWGNRIELEETGVTPIYFANPDDGFWHEGNYTPLRTGTHHLEMLYGLNIAQTSIEVFSLAELRPHHDVINLMEGGSVRLRFTGTATDGTEVNIPSVTGLTVTPATLGAFTDGHFVAGYGGAGYIEAVVGSVKAYIPVTVGGFPWPVDMFATHLDFLSQPSEFVSTRVTPATMDEREVIRLEYSFGRTSDTQASYATFYPALELPGEPIALRLQVYGDGSGHWLRGRVRDADGTYHPIDFSREANFVGWETLVAMLPNAPAPFTIDRIYMVILESYEFTRHSVAFHGLEALYAPNQTIQTPQGTVFTDRLRSSGFAGLSGGSNFQFEIPSVEDEIEFEIRGVSNFAVARMTARGGGIQTADIDQWRYLMPAVRALGLPYVVILLDENPDNFSRAMERELFHLAMTQLRDEGCTVFVVSATGDETTFTMRDNIRYIDVANDNDSIHFRIEGERLWWSD
ncbi:MAG: phosphodiester glycosidase family protein [Clostridiales bacterium]|nr:phosphodiester glycosidase family protein [Clostridiales bacterium]